MNTHQEEPEHSQADPFRSVDATSLRRISAEELREKTASQLWEEYRIHLDQSKE